MARGQVIPKVVRKLVVKVYMDDPSMPAKSVQMVVNAKLRESHPRIPRDWPGLSAVQKLLSVARLKHGASPRDVPWSLYTLAEFDIPADALQTVLEAYATTIAWSAHPLTIREAMWVARLYRVMTDVEELTIAARQCAENERINEITGKPSSGLVDADLETRAVTGKPGIAYKWLDDGGCQMRILDSRITDGMDFRVSPDPP